MPHETKSSDFRKLQSQIILRSVHNHKQITRELHEQEDRKKLVASTIRTGHDSRLGISKYEFMYIHALKDCKQEMQTHISQKTGCRC